MSRHPAQAVAGVGVAAISLYGLHQLLAPRLTSWYHALSASRTAAAEAEAERTAALTAALERLAAGQARLQDSLDGLTAAMQQQQQRSMGGFGDTQSDFLACQSPAMSRHQQQQQQQYDAAASNSFFGGAPGGRGTPRPNAASSTAAHASSGAAVGRTGGWDPYGQTVSDAAAYRRPGSAASRHGAQPHSPGGGYGYGSSAPSFEVAPPLTGSSRAPQPPARYAQQQQQEQEPSYAAPDPGYAARHAGGAGGGGAPDEAPRSAAFNEV
jgi:hypothetical protein